MKHLLKITSVTLMLSILALTGFASIEPALAQAATVAAGTTVNLNVDAAISISSTGTTTANMSNSINLTVNSAIATTTWTVKTNSAGGYLLTLTSGTTTAPAMKQPTDNSKVINDFNASSAYGGSSPHGSTWSVSSTAQFGHSAFGSDVSSASGVFNASGVVDCGATSTPSATLKYVPLATTTAAATTLASRTSTTTSSGIATTVCWAVEQNGFYISAGSYQATAYATAVTQ